ncbi:MAG: hypothetical protein QXE28_03360 [Desulfurococcaceae archaeon]
MSEHVLKILREELQSRNLVQMSPQKLSNVYTAVFKLLCRSHELSDVSKKAAYEVLKKLANDVKNLSKTRFIKSALSGDISPGSVDSPILKLLHGVLEAEESLISPVTVKYGHRIAFLFSENCILAGKRYRRGEIALIEPFELVFACIQDCGKPLEEPFYRFYKEKVVK